MSDRYVSTEHESPAGKEPLFQIDGVVVEVLQGCGMATVRTNAADELSLNRGTDGLHFDALRVGQRVNCEVDVLRNRVAHAHQQTLPMPTDPHKLR